MMQAVTSQSRVKCSDNVGISPFIFGSLMSYRQVSMGYGRRIWSKSDQNKVNCSDRKSSPDGFR